MHKSMRVKVQKAKRIEAKVRILAFDKGQPARIERARMAENRHWFDRTPKGELRTGNAKD